MGNPDNPTGVTVPAASLWETVKAHGELFFLIDEAFAEFSGETLLELPPLPNLFVLHSLTKFYAMAGIRAGFIRGPAVLLNAFFLPLIWLWAYGGLEYLYVVQAAYILAGQAAAIYALGTALYFFINDQRQRGVKFFR